MAGTRKRARQAAALAAGALALALACAPGPALASPLDRDGMWIWHVSQSGGSAANIAEKAKNHNIRLVLIKSSDGPNAWSQFSGGLVDALHRRGMTVCAWPFVYGDYPVKEARRSAEAVRKGADCLVIDAESHYEGRYPAADTYVRALRRRVGPRYPLALTSFPWVDYHPAFPYSVFLGRGGARLNVPQVYWRAIGASVDATMEHTYRWNLPYDRPIYPLGQTWQNPPRDEIIRFRRLAAGYGADGVSWWSWQETNSSEWDWVGTRISPPYPDQAQNFPRVARGARGDIVVLLQALLKDAGKGGSVNGRFNWETVRAVKRFQAAKGLKRNGVADEPTWRALREYRAIRIDWRDRGNPGFLKATKLSAKLPAALEVPSTPGRP